MAKLSVVTVRIWIGVMKDALFASFLHTISTDEESHHERCPEGRDSWCFFRRAEAKGEQPEPHEKMVGTPLNMVVASEVKAIYARLGDESL